MQLAQVGYEGGWAEHLTPITNGATLSLSDSQPQPLWITVYVPPGAPAGEHETTLTITPQGGGDLSIPVRLIFAPGARASRRRGWSYPTALPETRCRASVMPSA